MDRSADLLPFQRITSQHIEEVLGVIETFKTLRYTRDKKVQLKNCVETLTEDSLWLLTFSVWFSMYNRKFYAINESNFYTIEPSESNASSFTDFIKLLQVYNRKRVKESNEVHVIRFLCTCDRQHLSFYLLLLSKSITKYIPTTEVHEHLDMGIINLQGIYGYIEELNTDFSELTYPVSVMFMEDPDHRLCVHSKEPKRSFSYYQIKNRLHPTKALVTVDLDFINTPRYTLIGFADTKEVSYRKNRKILYEDMITITPIDYFNTAREYKLYIKGRKNSRITDYKVRLENLDRFLGSNYTRQIQKIPRGYAENAEELSRVVSEMIPKDGDSGYLVITDRNTARSGKAHAIPIMNTYGIIDEIWLDGDVPKGFVTWFNGRITNIHFDFSGQNTTLLNNLAVADNKLLEFTYIRLGKKSVMLGRRIMWDKYKWKPNVHKGYIQVEKCGLCGGTESPHRRQGLCKACEINIRTFYARYGVDKWIPQSTGQRHKRFKSGWHYEMPENLTLIFRDSYIIARPNGDWMFKWDAERAEGYRKFLAGETNSQGVPIERPIDSSTD